jgi:hypothetical protein
MLHGRLLDRGWRPGRDLREHLNELPDRRNGLQRLR